MKKQKLKLVVGALVPILLLVVIVFCFGGRSYKSVVKQFVENDFTRDSGEKLIKLMPDEVIREYCKEEDMTRSELANQVDQNLDQLLDTLDKQIGENWSVTYDIGKTEDLTELELEDIKDIYETKYESKVSDAKKVTVTMALKDSDGKEVELAGNEITIQVIKIGRNWYADIENIGIGI